MRKTLIVSIGVLLFVVMMLASCTMNNNETNTQEPDCQMPEEDANWPFFQALAEALVPEAPGDHPPLTAEQLRRISEDTREHLGWSFLRLPNEWDSWPIDANSDRNFRYLGIYNGWVVLHRPGIGQVFYYFILDNMLFWPPQQGSIIAWNDDGGRVYRIDRSFNQDFLSRGNLREIAYHLNRMQLNLEHHPGLLRQDPSSIGQTYFQQFVQPYFPDTWAARDVDVKKSFGAFVRPGGGHTVPHAVKMTTRLYEHAEEPWEETVAGILFRYENTNRILVFYRGEGPYYWDSWREEWSRWPFVMYTLQEAYDLEILTREDIEWIAYYHETGKAIRLCRDTIPGFYN